MRSSFFIPNGSQSSIIRSPIPIIKLFGCLFCCRMIICDEVKFRYRISKYCQLCFCVNAVPIVSDRHAHTQTHTHTPLPLRTQLFIPCVCSLLSMYAKLQLHVRSCFYHHVSIGSQYTPTMGSSYGVTHFPILQCLHCCAERECRTMSGY